MPVCAAPTKKVYNWLKVQGFQIVATAVDAVDCYTTLDYKPPTALVLGAESTGVSSAWREVRNVSIPMMGVADSLNVSTSAAVLFYEAQRQRRNIKPLGDAAHSRPPIAMNYPN